MQRPTPTQTKERRHAATHTLTLRAPGATPAIPLERQVPGPQGTPPSRGGADTPQRSSDSRPRTRRPVRPPGPSASGQETRVWVDLPLVTHSINIHFNSATNLAIYNMYKTIGQK